MFKKIKSIVKQEDKKRLLSNFFSLSVLQIFTYVLPLLTLPYLVRVLGIEKFGLVSFAQAFIMFFVVLVDYGFNLSATREISIHRDNKEKINEIFSSVMIIKFFFIIVSFILLNAIVFSFDKFSSDYILYNLTFLWVVGQALFPIWFFQGMESMKYITIVNIISKLIFTAMIFLTIHAPNDYLYVPLWNGLGFTVGGIISIWIIIIKFNQRISIQKYRILKSHFIDSSQYFLSRISVTIYTSSNAFVLGLFTSNAMVGYYAVAEKLYLALQSIYHPLIQTLYPYFSKNKNITMYKKIFFSVIILHSLAFLFFYNFSEEIINLLFSLKKVEIIKVFTLFLFSSILHIPAIFLGYPFLGAFGFANYANISVIYSSIFHIIGLLILSLFDNINIYSVATMVILTESMVFMTRIYYSKKAKLIFTKEYTND